ncbi:WhiB family transcriptional regulator [Micromonospora sp. WMMC241]|uniref:WhiB family transcriptional regulator n=1 Tax=Micromonospora sp. WMMC241 TaxID=3015159 RepID=UPI0022B5FC26|nr:WhiB family transcriptional regulator [Micromonospora sp. WMMC241]MCZ7434791.1 WhiB family transcriptional regulator [Micromonospora sp. WMMC241]MCZ7440846.1 WhiB family transcriptional regulator [Micromonospora sp. WMMC241]MCZ7440899.1 WhiB family transcriptional regulator [Micromonospora sp. WMMC241]
MSTGPMKLGEFPAFLDEPDADPACRGQNTDLFFSDKPTDIDAAKAICGDCPLRIRCRRWAIDQPTDKVYGVWGATSHADRKAIKRRKNSGRQLGVAA